MKNTQSKTSRLELALEKFFQRRQRNVKACVVVNERGLLIADKTVDGISSSSLAAMIALISDVTSRVNTTLNMGEYHHISFISSIESLHIKTFHMGDFSFRIGALTTQVRKRHPIKRLRFHFRGIEKDLEIVGNDIKEVMQGQ